MEFGPLMRSVNGMADNRCSDHLAKIQLLTEIVSSWSRMSLALKPTAIHFLPRLSEALGTSVYCKRDDLTGVGFGGNKSRKLEYLISDVLERGANCIVTCGSRQSNWCRMTAVAGACVSLPVHLVLGGGKPDEITGNLVLNDLVGATPHYIEDTDNNAIEMACEALFDSLVKAGQKPARLPMGGSTGLGALGYIDAFCEILAFEEQQSVKFSTIVVATGSGGTQAGLIAGKLLSKWPGQIVGMSVSRGEVAQCEQVRTVLQRIDALLGTRLFDVEVVTNDSYVGDGYRVPTAACREAIELFAQMEGIFLDEVYTGKAAAGLIDYARKGRFDSSDNVLFVHTGGAAQLFE